MVLFHQSTPYDGCKFVMKCPKLIDSFLAQMKYGCFFYFFKSKVYVIGSFGEKISKIAMWGHAQILPFIWLLMQGLMWVPVQKIARSNFFWKILGCPNMPCEFQKNIWMISPSFSNFKKCLIFP